jgi:AcrR family transcriptional regulator
MPSDAIAQPVTAELTGREARWERHNSERQKRILTSAVELIEERAAGAEVSVQQIADRAGLAKSVVYRQFSGRDDLDRRVRAFVLGQFAAALDASMSISVGTLDQILTRTISAVAEWITEHPRIHEFMGTGVARSSGLQIDPHVELSTLIAELVSSDGGTSRPD